VYAPDAIEIELVTASGRTRALAFFFSSDHGEPVHVHVARDRKAVKFWLGPVRLEYNHGFASTELNRVTRLVEAHEKELLRAWNEYFKSGR